MQSYIAPGENITLPSPRDVVAGEPVLIGAIFGLAQGHALQGEPVVLVRRGLFRAAKVEAQAWAVGARLYWDDAARRLTSLAAGNLLVGAAAEDAANPSAVAAVLLDGAIRP